MFRMLMMKMEKNMYKTKKAPPYGRGLIRGQNWFLQKKSEECVIPSSTGDARRMLKEL